MEELEKDQKEGRAKNLPRIIGRPRRILEDGRRRFREMTEKLIKRFKSRIELEERLKLLSEEEIIEQREAIAHACIDWMRDPLESEGGRKITEKCIRIVGELRAPQAVPVLLGKIAFRIDKTRANDATPRGRYAACDALVKIGKPSVFPALEALKDVPPDSEKALLYSLVIVRVEGVDVGRFILERELAGETDPVKRANLEATIKRLGKLVQGIRGGFGIRGRDSGDTILNYEKE